MSSLALVIACTLACQINCLKLLYTETEKSNKTLTLGYFVPWEQGYIAGPTLGCAIVVAIDHIKQQQILPEYDVEWIFGDDYCEPRRGMQVAVGMWTTVRLHGIIGSGCSVVCQPVSLLAASWSVPVISWQCASMLLSDKVTYPTFTRVETT